MDVPASRGNPFYTSVTLPAIDTNPVGWGVAASVEDYQGLIRRHNGLNYGFYDGHVEAMEWEVFLANNLNIWNRTLNWP